MSLSLRSSQRKHHLAAAKQLSQWFSGGGEKLNFIAVLPTNESQLTRLRTPTTWMAVRRSSEMCREKKPSRLPPAADFPLFCLSDSQASPARSFGETQKPVIFWCAKQETKTPYAYQSESDKLKLETFSF